MSSNDFKELLILVDKLKLTAEKATQNNTTFKKYHQSSILSLVNLPQHIIALEQGLSIATSNPKQVEQEELELVA